MGRIITILILICCLQVHGADKYTDENRPYEFGFKIDGEQHRHEKKDENGIIMGEFGFITADGVYHVTVYATDENGNFKILSMKNIRVKPYPTSHAGEKKGHSLPFPPSNQAPAVEGPTPHQEIKPPPIPSPQKSCSHCSLPTTKAPVLTDIAVVSKDNVPLQGFPQGTSQNDPQGQHNTFKGQENNKEVGSNSPQGPGNNANYPGQSTEQNYPQAGGQSHPGQNGGQRFPQQGINTGQNYPKQQDGFGQNPPQPVIGNGQNYPQSAGGEQNYPNSGSQSDQNYPQQPQQGATIGQNYPQQGNEQTYPQQPYPGQNNQNPLSGSTGERNPKQFSGTPPSFASSSGQQYNPQDGILGPNKPTLISAQMQIVDKNHDIYAKKPGEVDGLPNGLTKDDMMVLLYTFNYTVGFHGHFEEGYTNGAKQGYYYVTGRNGVRTRIDYVADEKGFRPKVTQEVLDLLSDDVPKPETEREEKYGLKGYEFKWIYYPVDSKTR